MKNSNFFLISILVLLCGIQLSAQNIYWIESVFDAPSLVKSGADGTTLNSIPLQAGSLPQGIASDSKGKSFFWTELAFTNARLNSISSDFSAERVVISSQSALRGIALDQQNNMLYWTSTNLISGPQILRSDGYLQEVLIDFGAASYSTPRSIGLDIDNGKMYWANFAEGKIQRADMVVGAIPEDIVTGLSGPTGLAVDADSGKIFWTEMNSHQIKSADLDGSNITLLVSGLSSPNFIAINRAKNRMAWTEMGSGRIKSAALDGTDIFDYGISATAPAGIIIDPNPDLFAELKITPADSSVQVHKWVQFHASLGDSLYNSGVDWSTSHDLVGPVSYEGLLFTYFPGNTRIYAEVDSNKAKTHLTVVDTTVDSSGVNKVHVVRVFPNGIDKEPKTLNEGEIFTLEGLPHPFNIINGSMLYFPNGSLHEDITVEIQLPDIAKIKEDSVEFVNRIVNGIKFDVFVGDSIIKPYYFDKPVSISIPFKHGILKQYNININDLGLFYAADSVIFDTLGISNVMVDSSSNRIFALVEHFSTLVIREKEVVTSINYEIENSSPERFVLGQNYPNPFNPTTMIGYQLAAFSEVKLSIYNILGQKVATLVSEKQPKGTYSIQWDASGFASGIYLYRLETNQGVLKTKKLILLK